MPQRYRAMVVIQYDVPEGADPKEHLVDLLTQMDEGRRSNIDCEVRKYHDVIPGDQHRHGF